MIHETCEVKSFLPESAKVWNRSQIMENVKIGENTSIGRDVFIGANTTVGDGCKIQNSCQIFGANIGNNVLLGPRVVLIEDPWPRAFDVSNSDKLDGASKFVTRPVEIGDYCSVGAGAVIAPGVKLGEFSMIAIGAVVLADVEPYTLVVGNPARAISKVCKCGRRESLCKCNCEVEE